MINPLLINRDTEEFLDVCAEIENPDNLSGSHTAIRYAVSSALLEAGSGASNKTKAKFLREKFHLPETTNKVKYMIQGGSDWYNSVDKAIYHRVDALPHALLHSVEDDFGYMGEKLIDYAKWIKRRISEHKVEKNYNPIFHFDCYGTIGRAFNNDIKKIADYILKLENTVHPFMLQLESPIEMGNKESQIEILGELKRNLKGKNSETLIVADEWCNNLDDISDFIESNCVDMIQVKMPDLGSIQGATALKLDNEIEENQNTLPTKQEESTLQKQDDLVSGVSLENAAYFENDLSHEQSDQKKEPEETVIDEISLYEEKPLDIPEENPLDEFSPQLFSDEETSNASSESNALEPLKNEEDEDFEIPAFLRKQKFFPRVNLTEFFHFIDF